MHRSIKIRMDGGVWEYHDPSRSGPAPSLLAREDTEDAYLACGVNHFSVPLTADATCLVRQGPARGGRYGHAYFVFSDLLGSPKDQVNFRSDWFAWIAISFLQIIELLF